MLSVTFIFTYILCFQKKKSPSKYGSREMERRFLKITILCGSSSNTLHCHLFFFFMTSGHPALGCNTATYCAGVFLEIHSPFASVVKVNFEPCE